MKKNSLIMLVLLLILISLVISACGGKGPLPPADTTLPKITLSIPGNGEQNVPVNSSIMITFSEAMEESSINEHTITLSMGTGTVPGTTTYSDTTAVFKPASSLNPGTIYTVTVDGGVKDVAGNAMVTPFGSIFLTETGLAPTTMSLSAPGVTFGANGIVTVTVSSAAGTPAGNVSLSFDGGAAMTQELINGSTTYTIPAPGAGVHTLNAAYAAQGNFGASSASGTLGVGLGATTLTLNAPGITYGANSIVAVTVSSASGIPTGNVSLSVDGGTAVVQDLTGGSTAFTIPGPGAGTHTLNAAYAEQGTFGASSASGSLLVDQAATTITIIAPAVTYGANGIVTVTVGSAAGAPTGNVSLRVDGGAATTKELINGSTTFTIPSPGAGTHSLNAAYAAQGNFGASSTLSTLGVGLGATTMTLNAPAVAYGANAIVTVSVSSSAGTPTGNVSLSVDGGTKMTHSLSSGSTTFTIPGPGAGVHTLNAAYAEQGTFGACSASGTLIVDQAATKTTINAPPVAYGADGSVMVTVSSAAGTPAGNVSLSVDGGAAMTHELINGSTTYTIQSPGAGVHTLNAAYAAQGNFGASSVSGTLGVGLGATTMTINAPGVTYGANGIVTVTVSSASGIPTGNVSLSVDGGTAVVQDLTGGSTAFTIPGPGAGVHTLNAVYAEQGAFGASSRSGSLNVSKASTSTEVTSSLNPSTFGVAVTFTATITGSAGTPTGTVTFQDGGTSIGTGTLTDGIATLSTSALSVGSHSITVVYSGDTNFTASTSSAITQTVNKATPTITWTSPATIKVGTPLSSEQLDATANVAGSFDYDPAAGTVLPVGIDQTLSTTFTPTDMTNYNTATVSVKINVHK